VAIDITEEVAQIRLTGGATPAKEGFDGVA
jgi:hypothetical protein